MVKHESNSLSSGRDSTGLHSAKRHTRNKKSDPFLELSNNDFNTAEQPIPRSPKDEDSNVDRGKSLFVDLVLTPLNMVTFIFGLVLVDRQNRHWRLSQQASPQPAWRTHWSYFHPEPYQDAGSSAWGHSTSARPEPRHTGSFQGWYARRKKGALAKLEIGDALEMRGRVAVALFAWSFLGVVALSYATRLVYIWLTA